MKISIVSTLYRSSSYIAEFHRRSSAAVKTLTDEYEIVFVNDGSPDDSLNVAIELAKSDPHIVVVDLTRNFGHHQAMLTGLSYARGQHVFLIDVDLEDQPEWLTEFHSKLQANPSADMVFGVQFKRKGGVAESILGTVFYWLFNMVSETKLQSDETVARLMTRRFVDNLLKFKEKEIVFSGLCALTGFTQIPVKVHKEHNGNSTYTFAKKVNLAISYIASFSNRPLFMIFNLGLFVTFIAIVLVAYIIFQKIYFGTSLMGWSSVIASIWLIGGMIIFGIGILGIYLAKVFSEVKGRPIALVRDVYRSDGGSSEKEARNFR
jgi:putative glycosyltransferase